MAYSWQLGLFFLCSPDCTKQPRTLFLFYELLYSTISGRVSGGNATLSRVFVPDQFILSSVNQTFVNVCFFQNKSITNTIFVNFVQFLSACHLVNDQNHYFGLGLMPKPKLTLVDTFSQYCIFPTVKGPL